MTDSTAASDSKHGTIRFEDLGEPVQRLLKSLKGNVSEADMALLEYVSVKDMAKIYSEMSTDRHAEEIWEELRAALEERRERAAKKDAELLAKQKALEQQEAEEAEKRRLQEEEDERARQAAEEAKRRRKEERQRRREEEAAAAEAAALAEQEAAEEAAALAEEEARREKAERKRKRREARARELQEEQAALEAERARQKAKRSANQQKDWTDYVQSHPLEFPSTTAAVEEKVIEQEKVQHLLNSPPRGDDALLRRTYTAKCPVCGERFSQPPRQWECPVCYRRKQLHVMVWQPDDDSSQCMLCGASIGYWRRHHCRSCGRLTCSRCCETRAMISGMGYTEPEKVCDDCAGLRTAPGVPSVKS